MRKVDTRNITQLWWGYDPKTPAKNGVYKAQQTTQLQTCVRVSLCKPCGPDDLTMKWYLIYGDILYLHALILLIKLGDNMFVGASQLESAQ